MTRSPPRVLLVSRNFPPLTGGMERLMAHTAETLAEGRELTVIGPAGGERYCPDGVRYAGCPPRLPWFLFCALVKGLWRAMAERPSLVVGGSGVVAPLTSLFARIAGASSIVFVHGLDLVVANRVYQRLFLPQIARHDRIVANSRNTRRLAVSRGCEERRVTVLHPGCSVVAEPPPGVEAFIESQGLAGKRILLFVGRMIRRKGLAPFLDQAWPTIAERMPDARLVVVGDSPADALLRDADGGREIEAALGRAGEGSIRFLGAVDDEVLRQCYTAAECLIFPLVRVPGDVEGFGMVAVEAAACGTPTVAFDVGGVADAVADGVSGALVDEGDYRGFAARCLQMLRGEGPPASRCREFAAAFAWPRHAEALNRLVADCLESGAARAPGGRKAL